MPNDSTKKLGQMVLSQVTGNHIRCMHTRPHRHKDQLPLLSLRDLDSRQVFAPVRPRLVRWKHLRPQGAAEC